MQIQELKLMDLDVLDEAQLLDTSGGTWPFWLKGLTWVGIGAEISEHWDEIKKGLADGWNSIK